MVIGMIGAGRSPRRILIPANHLGHLKKSSIRLSRVPQHRLNRQRRLHHILPQHIRQRQRMRHRLNYLINGELRASFG